MTEHQTPYNIPLSDTARNVYAFICRHKATHDGNSPNLREIAIGAGLATTSTATVREHLRALANAGLIRLPEKGSARGIEVVGGKWTPPDGGGITIRELAALVSNSRIQPHDTDMPIERYGLIDAIARVNRAQLDYYGFGIDTMAHIRVIHSGPEHELWETARAALGLSVSEAMAAHLLSLSYSTTKSKPALLNQFSGYSGLLKGVGGSTVYSVGVVE